MKKIANFWLGSVRLRVTGPFPERFLNLCGEGRVSFWGAEQTQPGMLEVTLRLTGLKQARRFAAAAGCEAQVVSYHGAPAFFARFRKRYAMLLGAGMALLGACILSRFVLVVDVVGNEAISDSVILTELESLGFGVGSYGPSVDERTLSNRALLDLEDLSYLNINIKGIHAQVEVRERTPAPVVDDPDRPADVTATCDGVILKVDLRSGEALVTPGQAVLAGEVLISGTNTYEKGDGSGEILSTRTEQAKGEVWAMTERTFRVCTPLTVEAKTPTGTSRNRYGLQLLKHLIKFYRSSSISEQTCDTIRTTSHLTLPGGTELPFALARLHLEPYTTRKAPLDREQAEKALEATLEKRLEAVLGEEEEVLSRTWETEEKNGVLTVALHASCLEQIGETVFLEDSEEGE